MLVNEARTESGPIDQCTEQIEVGIRRNHDIHPPAGFETLARLIEQSCYVAIVWTGVPSAIGEIARFARMLGRARQDNVEERAGRERREEISAHGGDTVANGVGVRILGGREGG